MIIKLFEDFSNGYSMISLQELNDGLWGKESLSFEDDSFVHKKKNWLQFTQEEIDIINKKYEFEYFKVDKMYKGSMIELKYANCMANIYKLVDEWYYIQYINYRSLERNCYKCDQWDGLLNCLDKIVKED